MLPQTTSYLEWARAAEQLAHDHPIANLYSSATHEPSDLLHGALRAAYPDDLLSRMDAPIPWGHPRLIAALAAFYGIPDPRSILVTSGCSSAYIVTARALLRAGDHVLVESPVYDPFLRVLDTMQVTHSPFPRPLVNDPIVPPKTRLIVISHLHNPTGAALAADERERLIMLAERHDLTILIDQVFGDWLAPQVDQHPRIVTISSLSKVYGLSALRTGWIIAAGAARDALRATHILYDNSTSRLLQGMATLVLEDLECYRQRALAIAAANRPLVEAFAQTHANCLSGVVPAAGVIWFPALNEAADSEVFTHYALEQHGVLVVPGRFFGAPGHIRIGFGGQSQGLQDGLARLSAALRGYNGV